MKAMRGWSTLVLALCATAKVNAAPAAARETRRFALVIGNNEPPRADLPRLRYADDDAVRWAVLFDTLGAQVEVLTELDSESRQLYGGVVPPMTPPSRAAVDGAVARLAGEIAVARAGGAHVVFYFVYAGHGDVEDGKGYVALTDAHFTREDLSTRVLRAVHADTNHVIVDACRASYFLGSRGPGGERRAWQDSYFRPHEPGLDNTGFLLASSSSGLSHEWEEFQSGIFSHEVRSGLMGPADANGDGLITYRELTGFVRLANRPVRNERFRPQIVSRVPAGGDDVLLDLRDAHAGSLALGRLVGTPAPEPSSSSHLILEDRAGVRWVDFHPGAAGAIRVILPRASWNGPGFYLRSLATNLEYSVPAGADINLAELTPRAPSLLHRGAIHDAFTHLFELAFDQAALDALPFDEELSERASPTPPGADLSRWRRISKPAAIGAVVIGGVSLAAAGALAISSARLHDQAVGANGAERAQLNSEIGTRNQWTALAGIGGAVLTLAGVGLFLWRRTDSSSADPASSAASSDGGAFSWHW
jgi:hypothetical protein